MIRKTLQRVICLVVPMAALKAYQLPAQQTGQLHSYSGPNGHVMVVVPGGEFMMGSPQSERGRSEDETQHRVRIPRTYAIGTTEVTEAQFARFLVGVPDYAARWRAATAARFGDGSASRPVYHRINGSIPRTSMPHRAFSWPPVTCTVPGTGCRQKPSGSTRREQAQQPVAISEMPTACCPVTPGTITTPTAKARILSRSCCQTSGACSTYSETCGSGRLIGGRHTPPTTVSPKIWRIPNFAYRMTSHEPGEVAHLRMNGSPSDPRTVVLRLTFQIRHATGSGSALPERCRIRERDQARPDA